MDGAGAKWQDFWSQLSQPFCEPTMLVMLAEGKEQGMGGRHLRPGWGWEGEGRVASVLAEASGASVVCGRTRLFPLPGVFVSYPQERSIGSVHLQGLSLRGKWKGGEALPHRKVLRTLPAPSNHTLKQ